MSFSYDFPSTLINLVTYVSQFRETTYELVRKLCISPSNPPTSIEFTMAHLLIWRRRVKRVAF